ncbi:Hypothetical protein UVM_LOCUS104 [uncultured virus]|nr:Hypothetical protein UVM_LOCUS104 [uncultured virus]
MDRAVWLNVGARLDWRSVQSLSCARADLASLSQDDGLQKLAVDQNWCDGRFRERSLPSELLCAQYLQTARLGGTTVLSALWYDDTVWVGEEAGLYDCRTMRAVARFANSAQPGGGPPTIGLDMTSDGRRALILRRSADFGDDMRGGLAVYLYDPCSLQDASELQPLANIVVTDGDTQGVGIARPNGALDRIVVDQVSARSNALVSYDVATGGQRNGAVSHQYWLNCFCEHGDGTWLAKARLRSVGEKNNLLQFDLRVSGYYSLCRSVHSLTRPLVVAGVSALQQRATLGWEVCGYGASDIVSRGHVVAVLERGNDRVQAWDVRTWRPLYVWSRSGASGFLRADEPEPLRLDARAFVAIGARTERENGQPRGTCLKRKSLEDGCTLQSLSLELAEPMQCIGDMSVCEGTVLLQDKCEYGASVWRMFDLLNVNPS